MTAEAFGPSFKLYADWSSQSKWRNALNVQHTKSINNEPRLSFELAPIKQPKAEPSWEVKISIQLNREEVVGVCLVLLGKRAESKIQYHGADRNKGILLRYDTAKGSFVSLSQGGNPCTFILTPEQRMSLCAFCVSWLSQVWQLPAMATLEILASGHC